MNKLFGIPMTNIMWVLLALFAVSMAGIAAIYISNRTMFRMGLRNIPRRGTQTALVVVGLMLSTLIITAAFTTGDSLDYSFTKSSFDSLQRTDLALDFEGGSGAGVANQSAVQFSGGGKFYVSDGLTANLETEFKDDRDIAGFLPFIFEGAPALNPNTRLSEPRITLAGIDPARLSALGGLRLANGSRADLGALGENRAFISKTAAKKLDARAGDTITVYARDIAWPVAIVGVVEDEIASGVLAVGNSDEAGGLAMAIPSAQRILGTPGEINAITVALTGGVRDAYKNSDGAAGRLGTYLTSDAGRQAVGLGDLNVKVEKTKEDTVKQAEQVGNLFTTLFLVFGLFSIAAGILLIFMIFVMLAAERKAEMGMARAVGAKRGNLVQMFVSEGMAYNVMAGAVGAALGVGAAFALVVGGIKALLGSDGSFLAAHVTPRSLIISYCLGVVLTFITVLISSMRVSRLNIVAAIRGTDDAKGREPKRRTNWTWVILGIPALVVPPLGLYWLLRKGFGLPAAWVWGPLGLASGGLLMALGQSSGKLFPFALGISLLPLSVAALARYYHAPSRLTWTVVGGLLAVYWLLPANVHDRLFGKLDGNIEMFVLSGIMIVIGFTLLIVFNARLLTTLFGGAGTGGARAYAIPGGLGVGAVAAMIVGILLGDSGDGLGQLLYLFAALLVMAAAVAVAAVRFPHLAPALKMGIAYPIDNRFRTGMTIAMFSLIVFSIVVMSTLSANFSTIFAGDEGRGGWDVVAETSRGNPVDDLRAELASEGSFDVSAITATGRVTATEGAQEVRQVGQGDAWEVYPVRAGEDQFFAVSDTKLDKRATGYDSDRAVFEAVRTGTNLALIDALPTLTGNVGGPDYWTVKGLKAGEKQFEPFQVEVRDPVTGRASVVTVVGVLSSKIPTSVVIGIYTNERTYAGVFGAPDYRVNYLRLAAGTDGEAAAKGIKAAMLTKGVQAFSIEERIDSQLRQNRGFFRIFQAFMGLGLLVGIAAVGVIAFRSVVERRQQIGMLRAIGYQRGSVALTFLLESSFIALMGILSGVVGAAILARNLLTSDSFTETNTSGFSFFIPWTEVIVFVVIAYVFALLLTWWPSRGASRVPIAEALRYE